MLLQISTTHRPATDLGYLLAKNPERVQKFDLSFGQVHAFYPVANEENCTFALLLEVDAVALVRGKGKETGPLAQYVNDRPYVASSFLSVAVAQVLRSGLSGISKERPELAATEIPLEFQIESVPCREELARTMFEPLGYEIEAEAITFDGNFNGNEAPLLRLQLRATKKLSDALAHLYVLLPVLDDAKHYFVGESEVEKLLARGAGWLETHPAREMIVSRYLRRQRNLVSAASQALEKLVPETENEMENEADTAEDVPEKAVPLHTQRIEAVFQILKESGAKRVLDLGCGEGRLLSRLIADRAFEEIIGLDASHRALEIAESKLKLDRLPDAKRDKIKLLHGALTYRDDRLKGFDAAALIEVIEHLDASRLKAFERAVFEWARPELVVLTTPNSEYNVKWESLPAATMRHNDHRFEWNRAQFQNWAQRVATDYGYTPEVSPLGPVDETVGAPSQMAVFRRGTSE
jgi:3' terminal RNA ribose 2'-O-methyltransferase Hen1